MTDTASLQPLSRAFYTTSSQKLARALLGVLLVRVLDDGTRLTVRIVETEAYCGVNDRASHAFGGRRTPRNEAMYAKPGTAYVYFTYGMHFCFNVVCGREHEPLAVLIRAGEPIEGLETMHRLREARPGKTTSARLKKLRDTDLCSGPARLCQALAIDRSLNGLDLVTDPRLFLACPASPDSASTPRVPSRQVARSARIGVEYAGAGEGGWAEKPLRWFVRTNPHVSGVKSRKAD